MKFLSFVPLVIALCASSYAGDALLRIKCDAESEGAHIFVNGVFKGECPLDLSVEAGLCTIEAVKKVGAEHERRWTQKLNLGDGAMKRVIVNLGSPQISAEAIKAREAAIIAKEKKAAEAAQARKIMTFEQTKKDAEAGDVAAMRALVDLYERGEGVGQSSRHAEGWQKKAAKAKAEEDRLRKIARYEREKKGAEAGDFKAMFVLANLYERGDGIHQNSARAQEWKAKGLATKEIADAQKDLKSAESGNIKAMEAVAFRYAEGRGLKQDYALSREWNEKTEIAKEKARKKVTRDESERKQRIAERNREQKREEIQNQIDSIDFFEWMGAMDASSDTISFLISSLPITTIAGPTDLIMTPKKMKEKKRLQMELEAHAAVWIKPDSMIAQAYQDQLARNGSKLALQ